MDHSSLQQVGSQRQQRSPITTRQGCRQLSSSGTLIVGSAGADTAGPS